MTGRFASFGLLALLFLIGRAANPQLQPLPDAFPSNPFRISVDFDLVVLPVTVRYRQGGFATGLRQENFDVFENGVRQSIRLFRHEDIPVTAGLVVDHSGSMQTKIPDILAAAKMFVQTSNELDQMFVVNFNERVTLGLPADVPFTDHADAMEAAILRAPVAGETALYDALGVALKQLSSGDREKKVLIVISDGGDNASRLTLPQILKEAGESNAILYTIGIFDPEDPDQNAGVLRRLAKETGGEAFFPTQYSEAVAICGEIARDIRHQYMLGYVSTNAQSAGHRSIRVTARAEGKDLLVRTRAGYIEGPPPKKEDRLWR